ncbi:MAG: YciI family protein [Actinomycetota bacterium]
MSDQPHPRYVVFHTPGPAWRPGVGFREQPGVYDHVGHYAAFHEEGKLAMGGPFLSQDGGGMMIAAEGVDAEELEAHAAADPAVASGLLTFEVRPWLVAMSAE